MKIRSINIINKHSVKSWTIGCNCSMIEPETHFIDGDPYLRYVVYNGTGDAMASLNPHMPMEIEFETPVHDE